ncbi:hypothetical protein LCGC14_0112340 [marine sediment metagenome]|uniref:Uncharacterized protein n=2 Tax=root TaxID=1 RepID=A0A7V1FME6_9RHOB|nr:hypothetical protein [Sulfitobacter litoralis]HDZ51497.1 hypothetical protein [Sulfitobacter litoralis]
MTDLLQIIRNIVEAIGPFTALFSAICFMIGFVMTMTALKMAQKRQEMGPGQGGWNGPIATFIIAGMFLGLPTLVDVLNVSLFDVKSESASTIFKHADSTIGQIKGDEAREMISGLVLIVQFMGLIAVGRGLYLLNQSAQGGQGPKTFGPGLTFVLSGIAATNFPVFVGVMEALLSAPTSG